MRAVDVYKANIGLIEELLLKGYVMLDIIVELQKTIPMVEDLFDPKGVRVPEITLDWRNLYSFINKNNRCAMAMAKGEIIQKERSRSKRQTTFAKKGSAKVRPESYITEKKMMKKYKNQVQKVYSSFSNNEEIFDNISFPVENSHFEFNAGDDIKLYEDDDNFLESKIPVTLLGDLERAIKDYAPLGYTIDKIADLLDMDPVIAHNLLEDLPKLRRLAKIGKHLIFKDAMHDAKRNSRGFTKREFKFTAYRDMNEPEKIMMDLKEIIIKEVPGDPATARWLAEAMNPDLFKDNSEENNKETGVMVVSEQPTGNTWESQAKKSQQGLRNVEEKA